VQVDQAGVGYAAGNSLTRLLRRMQQNPGDRETLERANVLTALLRRMPFPINYWHAQNVYYSILNTELPAIKEAQDSTTQEWKARFLALGEKLQISVPEFEPIAELQLAA
jgi:hypothetical protein